MVPPKGTLQCRFSANEHARALIATLERHGWGTSVKKVSGSLPRILVSKRADRRGLAVLFFHLAFDADHFEKGKRGWHGGSRMTDGPCKWVGYIAQEHVVISEHFCCGKIKPKRPTQAPIVWRYACKKLEPRVFPAKKYTTKPMAPSIIR